MNKRAVRSPLLRFGFHLFGGERGGDCCIESLFYGVFFVFDFMFAKSFFMHILSVFDYIGGAEL